MLNKLLKNQIVYCLKAGLRNNIHFHRAMHLSAKRGIAIA